MTPALRLAIAAVLANKFSRTTTMNNTTDTTNSGAAANTCKCGLGIADCCANACQHTEPFPAAATKATSGEAWQYPHDVPDALADKALSARVPGGSSVRDWFLPHESERAQSNVRDAMKCALFDAIRAAAPAPAALIVALKTPDGLHTEHAPACRCGSAALRLVYDGYGSVVTGKEPMTRYYVTCHGCEARGPVKPTAAEAAAAWRHMIGAPAAPAAKAEPVVRLVRVDGLTDMAQSFIDGARLKNGVNLLYLAPVAQADGQLKFALDLYGYLESTCPPGFADEAFRVAPETVRAAIAAAQTGAGNVAGIGNGHSPEAGLAEITTAAQADDVRDAAAAILRDELESARERAHPCDQNNDDVVSGLMPPKFQALYRALRTTSAAPADKEGK